LINSTYVWYNVYGYIWKYQMLSLFIFLYKKGGDIMTKREISQFVVILLLLTIIILLVK